MVISFQQLMNLITIMVTQFRGFLLFSSAVMIMIASVAIIKKIIRVRSSLDVRYN